MKTLTIAILILLSLNMDAQNVEVAGKVIISEMEKSNLTDSVVVRLPDGTLGVRDKATLTQDLADPASGSDAATKSYVDLLESRLNLLQNTLNAGGSVPDYEGNFYHTVKISNQVWMAENLRSIYYNDGTPIELVTDDGIWIGLSTPAYSWPYNDSMSHADTYGALYNYYVVADTNSRNICPVGWHVPDSTEMMTLLTNLGGDMYLVGGNLKETGLVHWASPNAGANNLSGFTGLPSGYRYPWGQYDMLSYETLFWSTTEYTLVSNAGWAWILTTFNSHFSETSESKNYGFSVRCLKD